VRNLTGSAVVFLLLAAAGSIASVSADPVVLPETTTQTNQGQATQIQGGLPAPKGRLKFKSSGPVCMCAEGMSERDIEQSIAKLKEKEGRTAGPGSDTGHGQDAGK